jgi:hypothetical protein
MKNEKVKTKIKNQKPANSNVVKSIFLFLLFHFKILIFIIRISSALQWGEAWPPGAPAKFPKDNPQKTKIPGRK